MSKYTDILRHLLTGALFLVFAGGVQAQNLPERSLVRKGNRQYAKENYTESIERYNQALEAAPHSFEAMYNLGNALYKAEQFERAEQTMTGAAADTLRTDVERAEAFYNLGNARFAQQKYREALESYKQSLRLNPADEQAKYNYAYTKRLLEQQQDQQNQQQDQQDQQDQQQQDQNQNQQNGSEQDRQDEGEQPQESDPQQEGADDREAPPRSAESRISEQEQERMLEAIQAQEDRTQEKLKEREGVVVRSGKNW